MASWGETTDTKQGTIIQKTGLYSSEMSKIKRQKKQQKLVQISMQMWSRGLLLTRTFWEERDRSEGAVVVMHKG